MPTLLPTTRYGRYRYRREKWIRRRRRMQRHNGRIGPETIGHHGGGKRWVFSSAGLQAPAGVNSRSYDGAQWIPYDTPIENYFILGGGFMKPPFIRFFDPSYIAWRAAGNHQRFALVGFQARRVLRTGSKAGRMNGFQRRCMGALYFANFHSYFPLWDPLARSPGLADVLLNPSLSVYGIMWWIMRPYDD